jgi:hypothetical protein
VGERNYRPLSHDLTLGPDLALSLHPIWPTIEVFAEQLERLYRQQAGVTFEVVAGQNEPALAMNIPLAEPKHAIRVLLEGEEVRYFLTRDEQVFLVDLKETRVDRGVYLLLAELAAQG